jgi:plasmid stability protein
MHQITISDVDDRLKEQLKQRAAKHGRSIESEAASILREVLGESLGGSGPVVGNLGDAVRAIVEPRGWIDLQIPAREIGNRNLPDFQ